MNDLPGAGNSPLTNVSTDVTMLLHFYIFTIQCYILTINLNSEERLNVLLQLVPTLNVVFIK